MIPKTGNEVNTQNTIRNTHLSGVYSFHFQALLNAWLSRWKTVTTNQQLESIYPTPDSLKAQSYHTFICIISCYLHQKKKSYLYIGEEHIYMNVVKLVYTHTSFKAPHYSSRPAPLMPSLGEMVFSTPEFTLGLALVG